MAAVYRFIPTRSSGWLRMGVAAGVAILCLTPMLWALGLFGPAEDAIHRAVIFAFSGVWMALGLGYLVGWALAGFLVKLRDADAEEPTRRPEPPSRPPSAQANRPPPAAH